MFNSPSTPFGLPIENSASETADLLMLSGLGGKSDNQNWAQEHEEGQLAVDVMETADEIIVIATMAGTKPQDIELHLQNDFLTIRGRRRTPAPLDAKYYNEECFWGLFSRTIVLPVDVKSEMTRSEYQNGVLTIHLPKANNSASIPIMVVD